MNSYIHRFAAFLIATVLAVFFGPGLASAAKARTPAAPPGTSMLSLPLLRLSAPVPTRWVSQPPGNAMRLAQFQVPGESRQEDAEVIFFYFGQGEGGSVEDNIARWQSQFSSADANPITPIVQHLAVSGMPVTTVELTGSYARAMGMVTSGAPAPDQTLLVAIVESPQGNLTIQLYGPRSTVSANREDFFAMVRGIR